MFSRFDTIPACDRRTDGRTDVKPIAITCFSIADARKNNPELILQLPFIILNVSVKSLLSLFVPNLIKPKNALISPHDAYFPYRRLI